jgi:hypothetical protein
MERAKRLELSPQESEAVDNERGKSVSDGSGAQGTAHDTFPKGLEPPQDWSGYDPEVHWDDLPAATNSASHGVCSPELRQLVRWWPNVEREIQEMILGLARPWKGDGA